MKIKWKEYWHKEMILAIPFMVVIIYLLVEIKNKLNKLWQM